MVLEYHDAHDAWEKGREQGAAMQMEDEEYAENFPQPLFKNWLIERRHIMADNAGTSTYFITISNTDNTLTQEEWSAFCVSTDALVESYASLIHSELYSVPRATYQQACWSFELDGTTFNAFETAVALLATKFRQESIALSAAATIFVESRATITETTV